MKCVKFLVLFVLVFLLPVLFSCKNMQIHSPPPVEAENESGKSDDNTAKMQEKRPLADEDYMKRFFENQYEWIGTTPGAEQGNIGKFVTKEWDTSEKAAPFQVLPQDQFNQFSDWAYAAAQKIITPRGYIDNALKAEEPFDLDVLMETSVEHRANVLFPHSVHTFWLKCDNCHPDIFIPKKNANPISMMKIIRGEYCGRCHGKVAFPIIQCDRCHSSPK